MGLGISYQVGTSPTIDNVGDARIRGFEIDLVIVPIDALTIKVITGHLDARYTRLDPAVAVTSGTIAGFQAGALVRGVLPQTPTWKFSISPRVERPVGEGKVVILGDETHTTKFWNNVERTVALLRPSTDLFNASIGYPDPSDRYSLTLGGTDLSDERYFQSGNSIPASSVVSGLHSRPREWYLPLGANF
jgi:iron complex outermembrane recepter protein